jgi:UDP-glucose 4-epimerase
MKKKLLIFGRNGFLAKELKIFILKKKFSHLFISSKQLDLTNINSAKKLLKFRKSYNIVFLAAITPDKGKDENIFLKNISMINNFFKFFNLSSINHFTYISSDAVYSMKERIIDEKTITSPDDLYGMMHLVREKIIQSKIAEQKLLILRPTIIYGKNDTHNSYGPNRFVRQIKDNKNITLFGKGLDVRDHIFVKDVVRIISYFSIHTIPGVFNIATGKSYTFKTVAKDIMKIFRSRKDLNYILNNGAITARYFNIKKLRKKINFNLSTLNKGIKNYL